MSLRSLPVAFYVPNLICYARILTALIALYVSSDTPVLAVQIWIVSATLDLIDGPLARLLDQCSSLGILLDICADNILRTSGWIASVQASAANSSSLHGTVTVVACMIISLEWWTTICTQLLSIHDERRGHWKDRRHEQNWLVSSVFNNNFKNPLGMLVMYGLFSANLWTYGRFHAELYENIPLFEVWMYVAYAGRGVSMLVEVWLCQRYFLVVIKQDQDESIRGKQTTISVVEETIKDK
jgi:CDP-diacylglycerol--inositol 3-phosphatidyltransferase